MKEEFEDTKGVG